MFPGKDNIKACVTANLKDFTVAVWFELSYGCGKHVIPRENAYHFCLMQSKMNT